MQHEWKKSLARVVGFSAGVVVFVGAIAVGEWICYSIPPLPPLARLAFLGVPSFFGAVLGIAVAPVLVAHWVYRGAIGGFGGEKRKRRSRLTVRRKPFRSLFARATG